MAKKKNPIKGAVIQKKQSYRPRITDLRDRILNYGDVTDDLVEIREKYYRKKHDQ